MYAVRLLMPGTRRWFEALRWAGLGLIVLGVALTMSGTGIVSMLALAPIVGGGSLFVLSSVWWWQLAVDTAQDHRAQDESRRWPPAGYPVPSVGAVSSARRIALVCSTGLAVLALVVGVGSWGLPLLDPTRSPVARPVVREPAPLSTASTTPVPTPTPDVTSNSIPAGTAARGSHDDPVAPFTIDGRTVGMGQVEDEDASWAACSSVIGDSGCFAWGIAASVECDLELTIGFADSESGPLLRTEERSVRLRPGTPALLASVGSEAWTSIESASCVPRPEIDDSVATWFATQDYEVEPEGCWDIQCVGFDVIPAQDCRLADVQFSVFDDYGDVGNPHDVVIPLALHNGVTVTAWAGGIDSFEGDAVLTRITCR